MTGRTILGLDYGTRRIGVAVAEIDGLAARPLATIAVRGAGGDALAAALKSISNLAHEHNAAELVVGLPLDANGDEGPMAVAARAFGARVSAALGLPVTYRDERWSSNTAEGRLGRLPRGRSGGPPSRTQRGRYRGRVDREAAAIILQDELDARRAEGR